MEFAQQHLAEFIPFMRNPKQQPREDEVVYEFFNKKLIYVTSMKNQEFYFQCGLCAVTRSQFLKFVEEDAVLDAENIERIRQIDALGGKIVSLEGNIGVGKSTLADALQQYAPHLVQVYNEPTNEKFLQLFYKDGKKYAFVFQMTMVQKRIYQSALARRDKIPDGKHMFIWDRSMIGDYVFAIWNYLLGSISIDEMEVYETEFGSHFSKIQDSSHTKNVSIFVFLDDEPVQCKKRVEELRKNPSEDGIPLDYYTGIDDVHFFVCMKLCASENAKVTILNWGSYDDPNEVLDHLKSLETGERDFAEVKHLDALVTGFIPDHRDIVYNSAESIFADYARLDTFETMKGDYVYVNKRICLVPEEKLTERGIVREKGTARYNIQFYENEFKRVVMRHLACGRTVEFF